MIRGILEKKNKKAISAMVGYVMLITFGIIMSVIVYNYLKTYVPKDLADCPDGTSIFVKEYTCVDGWLNITLKNNGKFNYAGYYIHGANYSNQTIATINLVKNFYNSSDGLAQPRVDSYILFTAGNENYMKPKTEVYHSFLLDNNLELIEITPVRFQQEGNSVRFVSCGKSKTREEIICS
ncbi:hypothetical protein GW931_00510 [archaeon]|nr:hypothetical protein [archaeon]